MPSQSLMTAANRMRISQQPLFQRKMGKPDCTKKPVFQDNNTLRKRQPQAEQKIIKNVMRGLERWLSS